MIFSNTLLASLGEYDRALMLHRLTPVDMPRGVILAEPSHTPQYAYFPAFGVCSMGLALHDGSPVEVAMFGSEGFSLPSLSARDRHSPFVVTMLSEGYGHQIRSDDLISALNDSFTLQRRFNIYAQAISMQFAWNAVSNANATIDRRLARWLLMFHDRSHDDEIQITHGFLGDALHVRRQSITTSLHFLEGKHLVRAGRGSIFVSNRKGLEKFASDAYGAAEAAYSKLMETAF